MIDLFQKKEGWFRVTSSPQPVQLETEIERVLTKFGSVTRPDLFLLFRNFDEGTVLSAVQGLIASNRVSVSEDDNGVTRYIGKPNFIAAIRHYSTSSGI